MLLDLIFVCFDQCRLDRLLLAWKRRGRTKWIVAS